MEFDAATPGREPMQEVWVEVPHRRVWLHVLLFLLTLLSSTWVGVRFHDSFVARSEKPTGALFFRSPHVVPSHLLDGLWFSLPLLLILAFHEWGHLAAARRYGIAATYPYFIPAPTLIGTMGAFIRIKSPFRTRQALFDVGIWGPFAGFILAVPVLVLGLAMSHRVIGLFPDDSLSFGSPPLILLLNRFLNPKAGEFDLLLHPVARAAWVGLFATALNLLPAGQLDGGHILYALSPRWHKIVSRGMALLLAGPMIPRAAIEVMAWWHPQYSAYWDLMGDRMDAFYWPGWFIWGVFVALFWRHPPVYDPTPVDSRRRTQALIALAIFLLCFTLVPFRVF